MPRFQRRQILAARRLQRFMSEAADKLARLFRRSGRGQGVCDMPISSSAIAAAFLPTAWSLDVGGISDRVRGVILLDAVYGETR